MKMININTKKIKKRDTIYNVSKIIKYCSINIYKMFFFLNISACDYDM